MLLNIVLMTIIGSYLVPIKVLEAGMQTAVLAPATKDDMPTDWSCDWDSLWINTDFECQNIVKLDYENQVWGLVRYGLYPYPGSPPEAPKLLEIENIEANPFNRGQLSSRLVEPVGKWLIWYSTKVSLQYCSGELNDTAIYLVSLEPVIEYYRDTIKMQDIGAITIAPGEDGYAFEFSRAGATSFCQRLETEWGVPTLI
ncbi:MAG: hypothetical protein WBB28_09280 [Crinalium sp.]